MPTAECPKCRMPMASGMGQMYCPQCGWNRGQADRQTRLFLRVLPVLVMVFDAPLILYVFVGHAEVSFLALLGLLAIVPAILVALVMKGKIRMGAFGGNPRSLP